MGFIGDLVDIPDFFFPSWICNSMTAIYSGFIGNAYLIAADGRGSRSRDNSIGSDTEQKIFELQDRAGIFAALFTGAVLLSRTEESDNVVLDLRKECIDAAAKLAVRRSTNLYGYAQRLSRLINSQIKAAQDSGAIEKLDFSPSKVPGQQGETLIRILLDGFYNGQPSRARIRLWHSDHQLQEPEITVPEHWREYCSGSPTVSKLVFDTDDERFSKYRVKNPESPQDWVRRAKGCIDAHSHAPDILQDGEWTEIEKIICKGIGGHTHMATVEENGFQWITGLEPIVPELPPQN